MSCRKCDDQCPFYLVRGSMCAISGNNVISQSVCVEQLPNELVMPDNLQGVVLTKIEWLSNLITSGTVITLEIREFNSLKEMELIIEKSEEYRSFYESFGYTVYDVDTFVRTWPKHWRSLVQFIDMPSVRSHVR